MIKMVYSVKHQQGYICSLLFGESSSDCEPQKILRSPVSNDIYDQVSPHLSFY